MEMRVHEPRGGPEGSGDVSGGETSCRLWGRMVASGEEALGRL